MTAQDSPNAAARNRHHTHSHLYRSQTEFDEELFGRGPGDPDAHGYPGQVMEGDAIDTPESNADDSNEVPF